VLLPSLLTLSFVSFLIRSVFPSLEGRAAQEDHTPELTLLSARAGAERGGMRGESSVWAHASSPACGTARLVYYLGCGQWNELGSKPQITSHRQMCPCAHCSKDPEIMLWEPQSKRFMAEASQACWWLLKQWGSAFSVLAADAATASQDGDARWECMSPSERPPGPTPASELCRGVITGGWEPHPAASGRNECKAQLNGAA